ncbi:helix-turn-helix domain-containing protein [Azospirillum sp. SYSU D00513]|uniref:helix-turn-helix domain-containing protein n=1 Tax=Azospirillum sp. SYSU D00513 TaxID=2812561 RepID=UPI001A96E9A1|nr:helix-turn-helix domain-containing protein [Azospirillum sp. SYSU D00513]
MLVKFAREIDDADIANARRAADHLRSLIRNAPEKTSTVAVHTEAGTLDLDIDLLRSVTKIVDMVSAPQDTATAMSPEEEITPRQAADLLRMSRPSVMRLIEKGHLRARKVNTHHRLSRAEVLAYRETQAVTRRESLTEIARISETYDF